MSTTPAFAIAVSDERSSRLRRATLLVLVCVILTASAWSIARLSRNPPIVKLSANDDAQLDRDLQQAATLALGDRRGAVIVMDPQTGRLRAVVNPGLAFRESFPLGSTIKPFTTLAALRTGLIDEDARTLCREKYDHAEFHANCTHPVDLPPLNPTEAIAYSCNYYFGKLGERLPESDLDATLTDFGFARKTGIHVDQEAAGRIARSAWQPQSALGEGEYLQTTPLQLITAYTALVNGGREFVPQVSPSRDAPPEIRAQLSIPDETRKLIVKGMRGAVRYGTAESANLYSLPAYIFGKTGSATELGGFRTHGWFVGFVSKKNDRASNDVPAADEVELAVLVFLARGRGVDAAQLARPILAEFARRSVAERASKTVASQTLPPPIPTSNSFVRVYVDREKKVETMSVEDYVRGVVAAEGSIESEPEALKALAVASRTYVLKNLGRHAKDGFDFCTMTHCQRYVMAKDFSAVPDRIAQAVAETNGEILRDGDERIADSYFSASCGGETANLTTLWGGTAPVYLQGVHDEFCETQEHHRWIDKIPEGKLAQALQSDFRTDVGPQLRLIEVSRKDATGRAELVIIAGNRQVTVSGWEFKIIVGRALGWNLLKSSRFTVSRHEKDFVFEGSGFGHGLGLCQEGAHVMAARGANYRQILNKYFPSTRVAAIRPASADLLWGAPGSVVRGPQSPVARRTISSENFRVDYPISVGQREAERLVALLQASRQSLISRARAAGINLQLPLLELFINETTGNFVGRTGQPAWAAAASQGRRVELQPLLILKRRGILETTLRHELAHAAIDSLGRGRTPRWLAEGLAIYLAGEGKLVERYSSARLTTDSIERMLSGASSAQEMRAAYAAAYSEVKRLIQAQGEAAAWRQIMK